MADTVRALAGRVEWWMLKRVQHDGLSARSAATHQILQSAQHAGTTPLSARFYGSESPLNPVARSALEWHP
ncbi:MULTISPECIES: hypothetical protein [unclassified Sphingomonas]|uniref:hypothetical protein n=1 Tax=unclassified Sphingomonas TaxID=196159 RepID=UPI00226A848E|nr:MULTISPECIES: hypothetical protein [unclassified Sphingomonas]